MNIGQVADATGLSARMIRHYEAAGVVPRPARSAAGYRRYESADVARLRFVVRAREAGFDIAGIKRLVMLWQDRSRSARDVRRLVETQLRDIDVRVQGLITVRDALAHLLAHCRGDDRPDCPILEAFAGTRARAAALTTGGRAGSASARRRRAV